MIKFLLVLALVLLSASVAIGQSFDITCPDGKVFAEPNGDGMTIVCVPYTPVAATDTPVAATATPTPAHTATRVPPTATPTSTPTPRQATATPLPTVEPPPGVVAFPGAEGFGIDSMGGRGGRVMEVTNLNDSGAGTLRACIIATGPRICVFRVAGIITLNTTLTIWNPYLTIAGQTAPGGGITLKAANPASQTHIHIRTHNVIVRYLTSRPGTHAESSRALSLSNPSSPPNNVHDVVIDHLSLSWAGDETVIVWAKSSDVTIQWSIMAESLPNNISGSVGIKGPVLGDDTGGGRYSMHHNLIAHHYQRYPQIRASGGVVDVVNNVMYNMGTTGAIVQTPSQVNFVGNYAKVGPNTRITTFVNRQGGQFYTLGNIGQGLAFGNGNSATRYTAPPVTSTTAQVALEQVLANAGNTRGLACDGTWFARRDAVDARIVQSVMDGTRGHDIALNDTYNDLGYISEPSDVGGWPQLAAGTPCPDSDKDGMPDAYEIAQGYNLNADDSATVEASGYTRLDRFLAGKP